MNEGVGIRKEQTWSNKKAGHQGDQHTNLGQFVGVFSGSFHGGGGGSNRRRGVEGEVEAFFKTYNQFVLGRSGTLGTIPLHLAGKDQS